MTSGKYDRSIELRCPTCGGTQFEFDDADDTASVKCTSCSLVISREDLISANGDNIGAHVEQIKDDVAADLRKQLQDAFKGSKMFKVK
ncbi:hypothetical protein ACFONC_09140 [Luteimonas soli]|uniref:TFIIB-type domain-containing protein n=1 Tax=Luteimonas soli TaxID=1648966 RepID=A0ABV7XMR9_9GAMM